MFLSVVYLCCGSNWSRQNHSQTRLSSLVATGQKKLIVNDKFVTGSYSYGICIFNPLLHVTVSCVLHLLR